MEEKVYSIFDSKMVLRQTCEVNALIKDRSVLFNVYLLNIKHVKRNGYIKRFVVPMDVLTPIKGENGTVYKLRDDLRKDIFDWYNIQLTNLTNRKLANAYCNIEINNHRPEIYRVVIDDYFEDMKDLLIDVPESSYILTNFDLSETNDIISEEDKSIDSFGCITDEVMPLYFFNKVTALYYPELEIEDSPELKAGHTVAITDPNKVLPGINITKQLSGEYILFTNKYSYILDVAIGGSHLTMRKSNLDEYFLNMKINYTDRYETI